MNVVSNFFHNFEFQKFTTFYVFFEAEATLEQPPNTDVEKTL